MSRSEDVTRLRHMVAHAQEAITMATGRSRADLDTDRQFNLAMTRLMEIIGEAAARVTYDTRHRHPEVPWLQIVAFRNRIIHGYDRVDFDIMWQIVQNDLPPLVSMLEQVLAE